MGRWTLASLMLAAALGACTAVDDFRKFKFVDDGGTGDLAGTLPGFGQPCTTDCAQPNPLRPLTCFHMFGSRTIPGGICTRSCSTAAGAVACADFPDAACVTVENVDVCLPRCDPSVGRNCRTGFSCCDSNNVVTGPGTCAPTMTDLCH
jgi:hypothetical protein